MFQEELASLEQGMAVIGVIAFGAVGALLWLGLGCWRRALALVATLAVGLCWSAAFAALAVGTLNLISVAFAVLFIGLGVDFGIHYLLRAEHEAGRSRAPLIAAARQAGGVLGLCALSSAVAFYAFLPTDYRGLSELGLISGSAMFLALAATFTALPALAEVLRVDWRRTATSGAALTALVLRLEAFAARRAPGFLIVVAMVAVMAALAVPLARFDNDPMNLRAAGSPAVAALKRFSSQEEVSPYRAQVLVADSEAASRLAAELKELPEVRDARGLADLVPGDQEEKLDLLADLDLFISPLLLAEAAAPSTLPRSDALAGLIATLKRDDALARDEARRLARTLEAVAAASDLALLDVLMIGDLEA
jgi:predicted exporter